MGKITKDPSEDSLVSLIRVLNPESPEYEAGMLTINGKFHAIVLRVFFAELQNRLTIAPGFNDLNASNIRQEGVSCRG
jgi:hypothetical protein